MSEIDDLKRRMRERQAWFESVIKRAEALLQKHGKVLDYHEHSCHTTITRELKDFGGFSFWSHGAYTMFGGEKLKVWRGAGLVLEIEWWDIKELRVLEMRANGDGWVAALESVFKRRDAIATGERRREQREARADARKRSEQRQLSALQAEAARLRI